MAFCFAGRPFLFPTSDPPGLSPLCANLDFPAVVTDPDGGRLRIRDSIQVFQSLRVMPEPLCLDFSLSLLAPEVRLCALLHLLDFAF